MSKNLKKDQKDFYSDALALLDTYTAIERKQDHTMKGFENTVYVFETVCGVLRVTVRLENTYGYHIFLKFDTLDQAIFDKYVGNRNDLNTHSYKWNVSASSSWFVLTELEERLDIVIKKEFNNQPITID